MQKRTFYAKMDTIKDRNGKDLTEAEDIKKRQQEHRRTVQKSFNDPVNHDGVGHSPRAKHPRV